jgi:hypothetical protein
MKRYDYFEGEQQLNVAASNFNVPPPHGWRGGSQGCAVCGFCRLLCCDRGFESHSRYGCVYLFWVRRIGEISFAHSNAGVVGSNPTRGMGVFVLCLYRVKCLFACWDRGFESHPRHGCFFFPSPPHSLFI